MCAQQHSERDDVIRACECRGSPCYYDVTCACTSRGSPCHHDVTLAYSARPSPRCPLSDYLTTASVASIRLYALSKMPRNYTHQLPRPAQPCALCACNNYTVPPRDAHLSMPGVPSLHEPNCRSKSGMLQLQ